MDGFRRMLWIGRQHSADHIPVSALQLVTPPDGICNPVRNVLCNGRAKGAIASSPDVAACGVIRGNGATNPGFRRKRLHPGYGIFLRRTGFVIPSVTFCAALKVKYSEQYSLLLLRLSH